METYLDLLEPMATYRDLCGPKLWIYMGTYGKQEASVETYRVVLIAPHRPPQVPIGPERSFQVPSGAHSYGDLWGPVGTYGDPQGPVGT